NKNDDITNEQIIEDLQGEIRKMESAQKAPEDYRGEIVKDNYNDFSDRFYGNNDVMANTPFHGTHVSDIIAAARNNGVGTDGIADNGKIMMVRAVPEGDGHEKDIALVIRYAVDNGKKDVDVFAPGVKIYSTIPGGDTYGDAQGTSMASPVVAGVAALILEYYPNLTPEQVKFAIEKSALKPDMKVKNPGTDDDVDLNELSKTGGILNAYEAVKLASTLKGERKQENIKTKSTVKPTKRG